jgi:DNA-binding response OmpR family regulator
MDLLLGELEIITDRQLVRWQGREVPLRPMEYRLLVHLAANPGRVHTRSSLLREVWGAHEAGTRRTVDVHVARLRRALAAAGRALVTVRRVGYRLDASALKNGRI